jgi:predicted PhzF superfamily epimerase YddE/YHI9
MGRPGEIKLEIEVAGRRLKRVRIGGFACLVARGKLFV